METTMPDETFEFALLREWYVDENGRKAGDEGPNDWVQFEALVDMDARKAFPIGHGRLTVTNPDELEVARSASLEPAKVTSAFRARLVMGVDSERAPAIGDLVAVMLADGSALTFDVVIAAADLASAGLGDDGEALVALSEHEAILALRSRFGLLRAAGAGDADAVH